MNQNTFDFLDFWNEALSQIKIDLNTQEFSTWFSRIDYHSSKEDTIVLSVPSSFIKDQVTRRYENMIKNVLQDIAGSSLMIEFIIVKKKKDKDLPEIQESDQVPAPPAARKQNQRRWRTHPIPSTRSSWVTTPRLPSMPAWP